ncbi:uncharacterized protein PHACADRAFT_151920 [Phanerochaete carnosa HHB-10118-sp]|uniref:Transcription regulator Rua1 C-terminal domain-containing protein n=1 Tax=Phanerochaete carnosa (strain HHB-10118-sp) TaxID=650164 RepID=K5VXD9_PHACS|nr:uncharacterized protein PHACADRAFT_151920 [Phanerochaete carnosa HHB-10118-sp]EKM51269.1 hypothetical protein PHACADRAFT_151920 [Phanerochaete carnosa HHB-10118-sp]
MFSFPATPPQRTSRLALDSPFFPGPSLAPYDSPTPRRDCPYPDLTARPSFRTLTAADTLLHLATSPSLSSRLGLYPSASTGSNAHSQSTQSTFPSSPGPCTPSRSILPLDRTKLDVLFHPFSSPHALWDSPRCLGTSDHPTFDAVSCSPVLHESERKEQERRRALEQDAEAHLLQPPSKRRKTDNTAEKPVNKAGRGSRIRGYRRLLTAAISHADFKLSTHYAHTDLDNDNTDSPHDYITDRHSSVDAEGPIIASSSSPAISLELLYPSSPPHRYASSNTSLSPLSELSDPTSATVSPSLGRSPAIPSYAVHENSASRTWPGRGTAMSIGTAAVTGTGRITRPRTNANSASVAKRTGSMNDSQQLRHPPFCPLSIHGAKLGGRDVSPKRREPERKMSTARRLRQDARLGPRNVHVQSQDVFKPEDWVRSPPRTRAHTRAVRGLSAATKPAVSDAASVGSFTPGSHERRSRVNASCDDDSWYDDDDCDKFLEASATRTRTYSKPNRITCHTEQRPNRSNETRSADLSRRDKDDEISGDVEQGSTAEEEPTMQLEQRTLPSHIPRHAGFPLFYRRFAVPAYGLSVPFPIGISCDWGTTPDLTHLAQNASHAESVGFAPRAEMTHVLGSAMPNASRSALDLYTPRWVRGRGGTKVGLCPVCIEPPTRGGVGHKMWLSMKFSAYKW